MKRIDCKVLDKKEVEKIVKGMDNKSEKILKLFEGGLDLKEIKKSLDDNGFDVIYNMVFNVVSRMEMKVGGFEKIGWKVERKEKNKVDGKKLEMLNDLKNGKSVKEVCMKYLESYNVVYGLKCSIKK